MSAIQSRRSLNKEVLGEMGAVMAQSLKGVNVSGSHSKQLGSFFLRENTGFNNLANSSAFAASIRKYLPEGPQTAVGLTH